MADMNGDETEGGRRFTGGQEEVESLLASLKAAEPVEPFTTDEKELLSVLMLRAADSDDKETVAKLQWYATNPAAFRDFVRSLPKAVD